MGKKTSRPSTKAASAASPASGLSQAGSKSSILRAAFSPSEYQLALFASVIQGLDAQHLRIHDTNTGRLQCEHALAPKETVTSLDWGYYGGQGKNRDQSKKKRKRGSDVNGLDQGDVVIAFGTSTSDIRMYSPSEDKVVGTLTGAHDKGIKDFKFTAGKPAEEAWSIGGDNKLVQWDLRTGKSIRTIHLPSSSVFTALSRPVPSNTPAICASQTPVLIDVENTDEEPAMFPAMRNQIHTIISSSLESAGTGAFLASDGERFINVFDATSKKLVRNLVADQEVSSLSLYATKDTHLEKQILAAVTENGTIELFTKPFIQPQQGQSTSAKANRKQMTQKANASLKIVRSDSSDDCVPVVSTSFQGHEIIVAYAEGGVIPVFERVKLLDENTEELAFTGVKAVPKSKSSSAITAVRTNGAKDAAESRVDESLAVVESGNIMDDDIEMDEAQEDGVSVSGSEDSEDDEETKPPPSAKKTKPVKQTAADEDVEMENAKSDSGEEEEEEDGAEPSFGELLRANTGQEVDVEAELDDEVNLRALVPGKPTQAVQHFPNAMSLATVLTQSLKTNDNSMLESCFHTSDTDIIRTTIQRLESSLAANLLQRLAERLASRPGRYGHLLVWVQWTCVAHGGALAGHPELLKRMATLYKVMDQRSSSLSSLLLLKGKLDMLEAQLGLRRAIRHGDEEMDSEDEDNVIYVEGQDDEDSEVEVKTPRTKAIRDQAFDEDESMMNGIDESEDDEDAGSEEDDEDEDEDEGILEIEAEESAGSSDAEESLEENEDDDDDEADSDGSMVDFIADTEDEGSDDAVEQPPPAKKSKTAGKKSKGGRK
ncbi:Small-subunit processome Utp12 [Penicillium hispanicum]|uniref:Small-subunit processome Utp12 n=1 Tax=Penicillium hispanicum TaxID=1080232 RepID=UPI00253FBF69|nr:Small-subunit processome Utp12 [Penicillium hispanicum]KAJ5585531.1 Small-subunit processome Utp12 [Penicillium hispanicum]